MLIVALGLVLALWSHHLWVHRGSLRPLHLRLGVVVALVLLAVWVWLWPNLVIFQKVAAYLLMPAGCVWLLLWVYGGYLWHHQRRRGASVVMVCIVVYGALGNGLIAGPVLVWLEHEYQQIKPLQEAPFEAVLVLGGTTRTDHHGEVHITDAGDRVLLAARMYLQRKTSLLATSGSNLPGMAAASNAKETARIWRSLRIPKQAIIQVAGPYNTKTEIHAYHRLVRKRGWKRVGLITSAWHLRRAMKLCRAVGLQVHPLPADHRGFHHSGHIIHMVPTGDGFRSIHIAFWELLGPLFGR